MTTAEELQKIWESPEGTRIEFKAASGSFSFEDLVKYCVALANEGGGTIVLGATDLRPRKFHRFVGRAGAHTRRKGLDHETNKSLLLRHIDDSTAAGATLDELQEILPGLSRDQVQTLLRELKPEGRVELHGVTKAARWFPAGPKRNSAQ
jgi:predicted HTH transcriptional regulator